MKLFFLSCSLLLLTACGFNRFFYYPDTNPVSTPPDAQSHYIPFGKNDSLHGLFFEQEKAKASIFILHGNAGNLSSWGEVADLFYQAGYQVFIFDYPNFGNSTGETKHEIVFEGTQAAVAYYKTLPHVKETKNLLLGFSLGGNLALKVATDNPDQFDALAIEAAFDSHKTITKEQSPRPLKVIGKMLAKNYINGNELIAKWRKPLLIIHSKDDAVTPFKMGENLYKNATGTDQKEFWEIKGPHLAGLSANFSLYLSKIEKLVE